MRGFVIAMAAVMLCAGGASADWRRGLVLNGSTEYVDAGDSDEYSFTDGAGNDEPFTISAWIKMVDATHFKIVTKDAVSGTATNREYFFGLSGVDTLYFYCYDQGPAATLGRFYSTALTSMQGDWLHVVGVYDGSEVVSGFKIYVNSARVDDSNSTSGTYSGMANRPYPVEIGARVGSSHYANGTIAAPMIWNRALSPAEVAGLYNETVAITNDGTSVEVPRRWIGGTNSVVLDLDVPEDWDSGDTVTNGTELINNGSAGGTATVVGTPDVSGAVKVPPINR